MLLFCCLMMLFIFMCVGRLPFCGSRERQRKKDAAQADCVLGWLSVILDVIIVVIIIFIVVVVVVEVVTSCNCSPLSQKFSCFSLPHSKRRPWLARLQQVGLIEIALARSVMRRGHRGCVSRVAVRLGM